VDSHSKAWDRDYCSRGRLWGGGVRSVPHLPEGSAVLELGCGDGKTLRGMPGVWKISALDISSQALQLTRIVQPDARLILADARLLPFREESFNAVFAFHVTGHQLLQEREALAREVARVLRAGGKLFFREFGTEDLRMGQGEEVEAGTFRRGEGIITHYFTEREVEELFCDLRPISVGTHRWRLRVKGTDLARAEVEAVFLKS
jgi:ubiquinone/menaquinone biosynthesis C-methylase UbiE